LAIEFEIITALTDELPWSQYPLPNPAPTVELPALTIEFERVTVPMVELLEGPSLLPIPALNLPTAKAEPFLIVIESHEAFPNEPILAPF
jgi:hypothetical protein